MVDTHCHLSKEYYEDIDEVVNRMNGIMIVSGCNDETNKEVLDLVNKYDNVYGTLGFHPTEIDNLKSSSLKFIEENLDNPKIVAIGEIGLDYYWVKDNKKAQQELFIKQINLANKYNLPIVIHSREANLDTFNIIKNNSKTKKVIHCYSYSLESAYEFIKLGVMLGIGGSLTFKNANKLKKVVENIDLRYLLLETDSPYMTPVPFRGEKNEPANVLYVAKEIALIKGIDVDCVLNKTSENAKKTFNL